MIYCFLNSYHLGSGKILPTGIREFIYDYEAVHLDKNIDALHRKSRAMMQPSLCGNEVVLRTNIFTSLCFVTSTF